MEANINNGFGGGGGGSGVGVGVGVGDDDELEIAAALKIQNQNQEIVEQQQQQQQKWDDELENAGKDIQTNKKYLEQQRIMFCENQAKNQEIALHQQWEEQREIIDQELTALLQLLQWEKQKERNNKEEIDAYFRAHAKVFDDKIITQGNLTMKLTQANQRHTIVKVQQLRDKSFKVLKDEQIALAEMKESLKIIKESNNNNGVSGGNNDDDDHDDEREIQIRNHVIAALQQQWQEQKENNDQEIAALNQQWEERKETNDQDEIAAYVHEKSETNKKLLADAAYVHENAEMINKFAAQEEVWLKLIKAIQRNTIAVEKQLFEQIKLGNKQNEDQKLVKVVEHLEPNVVTGASKDIEDSIEELLYDTDSTDLPCPGYSNNLIEYKTLSFIPILLFHGGDVDVDDDGDVDDGDDDVNGDDDVDDDGDDNDYQLLFHTDDQKKKKLGLWGIDQDDGHDDDVSGNTNNVLEALTIFYLTKEEQEERKQQQQQQQQHERHDD